MKNDPNMQRVLKNNPTGFTAQDFTGAHDVIMGVGALLQHFKDGVLPAMAEVVHKDLSDAKSLMLTPIKRRRGRKMVRLLLAAEILKKRAAEMALIMDIVDPEDAR